MAAKNAGISFDPKNVSGQNGILKQIHCPSDIKNLSFDELNLLAEECRKRIIEVVSRNGGHLASNLGAVELTLALAYVFDFDEGNDRVIFDVGHQSYTWKLISGRNSDFDTLRLKDGLSGFPKREESVFDFFNTGHSSTSISAALGFTRADRILGEAERNEIAVIGDGALTGGMAFEALNDAGQRGDPLIVILNDNQMSIDDNVGGMSLHLEKLRVSKPYRNVKSIVKKRLQRIPVIGPPAERLLRRFKTKLRQYKRETGILFEELGFRYYGPVNGHDIHSLIQHLEAVKDLNKPVLLHVLTQKGNGYSFAEDEPSKYHGVAPFVIERGVESVNGKKRSYTDEMGRLLCEAAAENAQICAITAAMTGGCGLKSFAEKYPDRFFDTGITEQHAVTLAAGMAAAGLRPFVALYSTFLQRAIDQILHDVCLQNLPVCILIDHGGCVSADGETHQGLYDVALLRSFPNLEILAPADDIDLKACLDYVLTCDHPAAIRYPKENLPDRLELPEPRELHGFRSLRRGGSFSVIAFGSLAAQALQAAEILEKQHAYKINVFSCICGNEPINSGMINAISGTKQLLLLEDGVEQAGFAASTMSDILSRCPDIRVYRSGVKNLTAGQASRSERLKQERLDACGIAGQILDLVQKGASGEE